MSRDQVINPNSVQSQFAILVRDKEQLQKQSIQADNERRHEESRLQHYRSLQSSLSEKMRIAHATLGVQSKKKQMLRSEIQRLQSVLTNDRTSMEDVTVKIQMMESEHIEKKFQFVKEMDGLNDELEDALRMYEEKGIEKALLNMESCRVIEHFLRAKLQHSDFGNNQHWKDLNFSIHNVISDFEKNLQSLDNGKGRFTTLTDDAKELRGEVEKKYSKALGKMELEELECLWEQNDEHPATTNKPSSGSPHSIQHHHPVNMHLFYGNDL